MAPDVGCGDALSVDGTSVKEVRGRDGFAIRAYEAVP